MILKLLSLVICLMGLTSRQSLDLRKDLARRIVPSDDPKGDRVFVWRKLGQRHCCVTGRC